jgi:Fur family transcriptional regulator, ferric uptake regulator
MSTAHLQRRPMMQELIAQGVRITAQRRVLIETIQEAREHIDAPTLLAVARRRDASIDRATVYRTLDLLKKRGLIDELDLMHLTGEKHFYEVKTRRDHVHLACFRCGRIEELTPPLFEKLKEEMARQSGFEFQVVRLEAGGLCRACAKAQKSRPA